MKLAAGRFEGFDPNNRRVAAELEARWKAAVTRSKRSEGRLATHSMTRPSRPIASLSSRWLARARPLAGSLARDLEAV